MSEFFVVFGIAIVLGLMVAFLLAALAELSKENQGQNEH